VRRQDACLPQIGSEKADPPRGTLSVSARISPLEMEMKYLLLTSRVEPLLSGQSLPKSFKL
jgi:hypothetical protein